MKQQRRHYPRYGLQKIVSDKRREKHFLTLTLDLAMGGMKIKTHHSLPEDERLSFKLIVGDNSIWLRGRIAYSGMLPGKQRVSGIQFIDLSTEDYALLQRYLTTMEEWPNLGRCFLSGTEVARV
jgi:hypothetical protein